MSPVLMPLSARLRAERRLRTPGGGKYLDEESLQVVPRDAGICYAYGGLPSLFWPVCIICAEFFAHALRTPLRCGS